MTTTDLSAYLNGLGLGASLIIAIGAQNTFVLVQALRKEHHIAVATVCALVDVILISAGVLGLGTLIASDTILRIGVSLGGAIFLFWFGWSALKESRKQQRMELSTVPGKTKSLKKTLIAVLAISLLNPHVYLDTVVMLGAISGHYPGTGRYFFGLGAITMSFIWFFSLSICGARLAPLFSKPAAWSILYLCACVMVWGIGAGLLADAWQTYFSTP